MKRSATPLLTVAAAVLAAAASPAQAQFRHRAPPAPAPAPAPAPPKPTAADWRAVDPSDLLVIDTNRGRILVALSPAVAPAAVARVQALARQHFYDGQTFFRVIDGFMDQTGDPKNTGDGGSTLPDLKGEFTFERGPSVPFVAADQGDGGVQGFVGPMPVATQPDDLMAMRVSGTVPAEGLFCSGVAGMARAGSPDSANSQFFLMRSTYPKLNGQYTPFGRVVSGETVVRQIKTGEPVAAPQDRMITVRLASDLPAAERPAVRVLDPASAAFKATVAQAKADAGDAFSVCEMDAPVEVTPASTPVPAPPAASPATAAPAPDPGVAAPKP